MKRTITAALAIALVCSLALSGCGGEVKITCLTLPETAAAATGDTLFLEVGYLTDNEATDEQTAKAAEGLELVWSSGDEAVCTVDADGTIHAVGAGSAKITVAAGEGLAAECTVTVATPLEGLSVPETLELAVGGEEGEDEARLETELLPADATGVELTYESSDVRVATVDEEGVVKAVGEGECTITVRAVSDALEERVERSAETAVTVTDKTPKQAASAGGSGYTSSGGSGNAGQATGSGSGGVAAAPPAQTVTCPYCGGNHTEPYCPLHYHGNGTDGGTCPVCGCSYSPVIDPSTAPDFGVGD